MSILSALHKTLFSAFCRVIIKTTFFYKVTTLLVVFALTFYPPLVFAATPVFGLTPDGTTNTSTDRAPNGTPVLNIAAPNNGGMSHNKFTDYNVTNENLVINNLSGQGGVQAGNSALAGVVYSNPNMQNAPAANVILNEVTSDHPSFISGYTEIFGKKADLIIANPNGISISGGGFLNTNRLSLVAGKPNLDASGNIKDYSLNSDPNFDPSDYNNLAGKILITARNVQGNNNVIIPLGLDASNTDYSDIIARTIKISGQIYANNLNVQTGNDKATKGSDGNLNATSNSAIGRTHGSAPTTELSLDSSYIGGMYAGRISLIATEEGLGVKARGDLVADVSDINLSANGDVEVSNVVANNDINLSSATNIKNEGEIGANNDVNITSETFASNSNVVALNDMNINSFVTNSGNLLSGNNLTINSTNLNNDSGNITAQNNLTLNFGNDNDYTISGNLLSNNNLNIIANNINNLGEVISYNINLNAAGNINNGSDSNSDAIIAAINDMTLSATNLNNYGLIQSGNNLTTNFSNNLNNNQSAFIFAGNDINFNVDGNLSNNEAAIYAENNLSIQNRLGGYTNGVYNISATIETYLGDINIKSNQLINKREYLPTQGAPVFYSRTDGYTFNYGHPAHYYIIEFFLSKMQGSAANNSSISSGNNLNLNVANNILNDASSIAAVNDANITSGNLVNNGYNFKDYVYGILHTFYGAHQTWLWDGNGGVGITCCRVPPPANGGYTQVDYNYSGTIKSGGNMTGNVINLIDNNNVAPDYFGIESNSRDLITNIGDINLNNLSSSGKLDIDYSQYSSALANGKTNIGKFKVADPSADHLFESRSDFIDQSKYFNSQYYFNLIGFNPNQLEAKLIGDALFQHQIIRDQLINLSTHTKTSASGLNDDDYIEKIRTLFDNAASAQKNLGLKVGTALSDEQRANLEEDIVWMEEVTINGKKYLTPKLYLANSTLNNLLTNYQSGAVISAGKDLTLNSFNDIISNDGSFNSGGKITLSALGNINLSNNLSRSLNPFSSEISLASFSMSSFGISSSTLKDDAETRRSNTTFNAGTDIQITSANDINITNNQFNSGGSIFIDAANDINNSNFIIQASDNVVMNAGNNINNIATIEGFGLGNQTRIEAGQMVSLNATNDITNIGATIKAGELLYLTAGNDITNKALIDYKINNQSATEDQALTSNANNIRSTLINKGTLESDQDLVLVAGNNINNIGSNITATNGSAYLEATSGDINITTAQLRDRTVTSWGKKKKGGTTTTDNTTNIASNIEVGGELTIASLGQNRILDSNLNNGNINIIGSNIESGTNASSTDKDLNLIAQNQINITSAIDSSYNETSSWKKGSFSSKSSTNINSVATNVSSDLTSEGDLNLTSGSNTNIIASNLSGAQDGNIIVGKYLDTNTGSATHNQEIYNEDATLNILNGKDTNYNYSKSTKTKFGLNLENIALALATGGVSLGMPGMGYQSALLSGVEVNKNTTTSTSYSETVVKSNLDFANDLNINSADNANIIASNLASGNDLRINAGEIDTTNFNTSITTTNVNDNASLNILSNAQNSYSVTTTESSSFGGKNIKLNSEGMSVSSFENLKNDSGKAIQIASSLSSGNNVILDSANHTNIKASDISADNEVQITTGGDLNILNGFNSSYSSSSHSVGDARLSWNSNSNELSAKMGVKFNSDKNSNNKTEVVSSNIISGNGDITTNSSSDITIAASNLIAGQDLNLNAANNLNIISSDQIEQNKSSHLAVDAGVQLAVTQNIKQTINSITALKDVDLGNAGKYFALQLGTGAALGGTGGGQFATYAPMLMDITEGDSLDESLAKNQDYIRDSNIISNAGKGASGSAAISVNVEIAGSSDKNNISNAIGSNLIAGRDMNLTTTNEDIKIEGSSLSADRNININSGNDINIIASKNTQTSNSNSFSAELDIDILGTAGVGALDLNGSISSSKSSNANYNNSGIAADNNLTLTSNNNTNISGANLLAQNDLILNVGNDLNIESLQNSSSSKNQALSLGISTAGSQSGASFGMQDGQSTRNWVDDMTTLIGQNSVTINTTNNTDIKGALIANKDSDGNDLGNLTLNTNSLTYSDIENIDKAKQFGINIGGNNTQMSTGNQGTLSAGVSYSMHEIEGITRATIGNGNININSNPATDEQLASLNRDINKAEEITKSISVDPLTMSFVMDWGRERSETSDEKKSQFRKDLENKSSLAKDVFDYSDQKLTEINPLHAISRSFSGINEGFKNIKNGLGVTPLIITTEFEGGQYYNEYKDGSKSRMYTEEEVIENPDLISYRISSNGILNNQIEASNNGKTQQPGYDKDGKFTVFFDNTAKKEGQGFFGSAGAALFDLGEVGINYLGGNVLGGLIETNVAKSNQNVLTVKAEQAKKNGETIIFTGHSGGGLRNYLTLYNSDPNQFIDNNGRSVLNSTFYGTPVNNIDLRNATNLSGGAFNGAVNKDGDFVGNGLGMNGNLIDGAFGVGGSILLFDWFKGVGLPSPHSEYKYYDYFSDGKTNVNINQNAILTPSIHLNSTQ